MQEAAFNRALDFLTFAQKLHLPQVQEGTLARDKSYCPRKETGIGGIQRASLYTFAKIGEWVNAEISDYVANQVKVFCYRENKK